MNDTAAPVERTIAWFDTLEEVREAEVALERHGVDAVNISVQGIDSAESRRDIDGRTFAWVARRAVVGGALGLVLGAVVGLAIGAALGYNGSDLVAWAMAGGLFGTAPGFFYAVATRLPAEAETLDTFADDTPGDTWIAVSGPEELRQAALSVLRDLHPTRITEKV